ncbi:MAG: fructose-1,6-bisphosphatase [Anaerovorax sp.]
MEALQAHELKYIKLLQKQYRSIEEVTEEIINLQAIINLPKGTEHFLSDLHGEYEAFTHMLRNASGVVRRKIDEVYGKTMTEQERKTLATLIYYPEERLILEKENAINLDEWYTITLYRLVEICKVVASKYTRSKVRKALPEYFDYIIDELLHEEKFKNNKDQYYASIIKTIIEIGRADAFIIALSNLIRRLSIDKLHIIGDIYDRGPGPDIIMDTLMDYHALDIQWGNHDILWMGAACGELGCIANAIRISARYNNLDILEDSYGINLRKFATFAYSTYENSNCVDLLPKGTRNGISSSSELERLSKIHKAIAVIQFKIEGQIVKNHPEYKMDDRLLLDKINIEEGTVEVGGVTYKMKDTFFPTIDWADPYKLSTEERNVMGKIRRSFLNSGRLQKHIGFLYSQGSLYLRCNSNLLYHGCIPMNSDESFTESNVGGKTYKGKAYCDAADSMARKAFNARFDLDEKNDARDYMWYLWCGPDSPLFGKEKMATFERYFIEDKTPHKENKNTYYKVQEKVDVCEKIMKEFGLDPSISHIINGHVPVKMKTGENPVKAEGKLIIIDGGMSKAYQGETGIAGYTLIFNANGLLLTEHQPFESRYAAINEEIDLHSSIKEIETRTEKILVADTDDGKKLMEDIEDLKLLLKAYRQGYIK